MTAPAIQTVDLEAERARVCAEVAQVMATAHAERGVPASFALETVFGAVARCMCDARYPLSLLTETLTTLWKSQGGRE